MLGRGDRAALAEISLEAPLSYIGRIERALACGCEDRAVAASTSIVIIHYHSGAFRVEGHVIATLAHHKHTLFWRQRTSFARWLEPAWLVCSPGVAIVARARVLPGLLGAIITNRVNASEALTG